jgi:endonuclease-3
MIRGKAKKRERLEMIMDRLEQLYPDASCALEFGGDGWRLLVMGRLSAQCTDARVNIVCKELFAKYPNSKAMAEAKIEDVEKIIRPCGLYRMKAESIVSASKMLEEDFGGILPDDMDKLLLLPGVGRKIANLLLGDIFHKPAIVADTHMIRICGRFGMYPQKLKDPHKVEIIMSELVDPDEQSDLCHRVVQFGRDVCTARAPKCQECPIAHLCEMGRSAKNV